MNEKKGFLSVFILEENRNQKYDNAVVNRHLARKIRIVNRERLQQR